MFMTKRGQIDQTIAADNIAVDWLTTIAIAAVAICLTQLIHEGAHALSCIIIGADLQEFSALHVSCQTNSVWQSKVVSGAAAVVNIFVGLMFLVLIPRFRHKTSEFQFLLWLLMLMNWLLGAGYWMFSGIANVGDWANVIDGWNPVSFWRTFMTLAGTGLYLLFVWLALKVLGNIIGGDTASEQISRATKLGILSYITVFLVILIAGLFNPYGLTGLPAIAALLLALGGMSPLLWMMQWFRADNFVKLPGEPLAIERKWSWNLVAVVMVIVYSVILGRTIYF